MYQSVMLSSHAVLAEHGKVEKVLEGDSNAGRTLCKCRSYHGDGVSDDVAIDKGVSNAVAISKSK
jgi:hypothetical protein